jgi:nucleotidyltransferase/DNA polymerase involved in DNA repair
MNEIEIIRAQLQSERQHVAEISDAFTAALNDTPSSASAEFKQACAHYLEFAITRLEPDAGRDALAKLQAARNVSALSSLASDEHWRSFLQFFRGQWHAHADALDALFGRNISVKDWRIAAGIDADSIFEERRRYAKVKALRP